MAKKTLTQAQKSAIINQIKRARDAKRKALYEEISASFVPTEEQERILDALASAREHWKAYKDAWKVCTDAGYGWSLYGSSEPMAPERAKEVMIKQKVDEVWKEPWDFYSNISDELELMLLEDLADIKAFIAKYSE